MTNPIRTVGTATQHQEITFRDDEPVRVGSQPGPTPGAARSAGAAPPADSFESEPVAPPRVTSRQRALTESARADIRFEIQRGNSAALAARHANLDQCLATIPERDAPSVAELRSRLAGTLEDLRATRARQQERVTEALHFNGESLVAAGEVLAAVGEAAHGAAAPAGMPASIVASTARGALDAQGMRTAATRVGTDQRAVAQLRAQERRAIEAGRADAERAGFDDGPRPAQIDWPRMDGDADYRQAVRDTLRRRQAAGRP